MLNLKKVMLGNYNVKNIAELRYYLFKYKPEDTIKISVRRGSETLTFDITLGTSD